jgi:hypothetical protein
MRHSQGAIFIFTMFMIAAVVFLTQHLMQGVFLGAQLTRSMLEREKARALALSGVQIAIAQLTIDKRDTEQTEKEKSENKDASDGPIRGFKKMLQRVLPHLNRWQTHTFNQKNDGFDGLVKICISCEAGKINPNNAFDFTKMEFKKPYDGILKALEVRGVMPVGELHNRFVEYFKKNKKKIDDISQLLVVPGLEVLDIFYKPPQQPVGKNKKTAANTDVTLQDIFTLWSPDEKLNPLFLSDSLCAVFSLRRPHADDATQKKESFVKLVESFAKNTSDDWDANWQVLEPVHGPKPKIISDIKNIFTKEFGPKVFSVLSCGKVGDVECHLLAVIQEQEREKDEADNQKEANQNEVTSDSQKQSNKFYKIIRVYWL